MGFEPGTGHLKSVIENGRQLRELGSRSVLAMICTFFHRFPCHADQFVEARVLWSRLCSAPACVGIGCVPAEIKHCLF